MFEMNEEQSALFNALTPLQKEVSLNSISGMNNIDAYKEETLSDEIEYSDEEVDDPYEWSE